MHEKKQMVTDAYRLVYAEVKSTVEVKKKPVQELPKLHEMPQ